MDSQTDDLGKTIRPSISWADTGLSDDTVKELREIADQVRHRDELAEALEMAGKLGMEGGVTLVFSGPSGTGKTMVAEALANELGRDLYRVDLSRVVSKYIGETEKNLDAVFDRAEGAGHVLLFDEADALFGKRTDVKDAHDRYANLETAYLLQRIEAYGGVAILATNLKDNIDPSFLRRVYLVIEIP